MFGVGVRLCGAMGAYLMFGDAFEFFDLSAIGATVTVVEDGVECLFPIGIEGEGSGVIVRSVDESKGLAIAIVEIGMGEGGVAEEGLDAIGLLDAENLVGEERVVECQEVGEVVSLAVEPFGALFRRREGTLLLEVDKGDVLKAR